MFCGFRTIPMLSSSQVPPSFYFHSVLTDLVSSFISVKTQKALLQIILNIPCIESNKHPFIIAFYGPSVSSIHISRFSLIQNCSLLKNMLYLSLLRHFQERKQIFIIMFSKSEYLLHFSKTVNI